jgi:hypothetical protein
MKGKVMESALAKALVSAMPSQPTKKGKKAKKK